MRIRGARRAAFHITCSESETGEGVHVGRGGELVGTPLPSPASLIGRSGESPDPDPNGLLGDGEGVGRCIGLVVGTELGNSDGVDVMRLAGEGWRRRGVDGGKAMSMVVDMSS